ncbi:hypothetical protein HK099_004066 [Clydaea vesicula]|uniref:Uncharacterized protein n=1 Tax=Clydaea vesicula TaxID=447962 RepID=A0AAD5U428_9FUNG|nr:hypothetical protein HK099_004066 [Clydaea vesicula]
MLETILTLSKTRKNEIRLKNSIEEKIELNLKKINYVPKTLSEGFGLIFAPGRDSLYFQGPPQIWAGSIEGHLISLTNAIAREYD